MMSVSCPRSDALLRARAGTKGRAPALALTVAWLAAMHGMARAEIPGPLADSGYLLRTWGMEDGLPESSATAIVQTQDGYLWLGTFNGLVRFNGDNFEVFNPVNTPQLPSAVIVSVHADKLDRLWVSTDAGLVVKDGTRWRALGASEGWAGNYVRTFAERGNGDLLITTFDGHVLVFQDDRLTELPAPPGERGQGYLGTVDEVGRWWLAQNCFVGFWNGQKWVQVLSPSPSAGRSTVACAMARGGGVWVLLARELMRLRNGSEVSRTPLPRLRGGTWSMIEDHRTNLWISSYDSGLYRFTPGGDLSHWTNTNGLGTRLTRGLFEDREQNLWIGSSGDGLRRLTRQRFFPMTGVSPGLLAQAVSPAQDGGFWIAYFDGGLFRHDASGIARISVPGPNNLSAYGLSVLEDRAGRLWYGEQDGCWWRRSQGSFEKVPHVSAVGANVRALFEDSRGQVWIASRTGAVVYDGHEFHPLGPENGLPQGEVSGFGEDLSGVVWVTGAEGVFRQKQGQFSAIQSADGQPLRGVLCFHADADGSMWMGTRADGLIRWRNGKVDRIGVQQGLPHGEVRGLIEDDRGYFWMPSNRGIIRASLKQLHAVADRSSPRLEVQLLDQHDGLPGPECSTGQPGSARDSTGKLWFATLKGVVAVDPETFQLNSQPPPVHVEQLTYHLSAAKLGANEDQARSASDGVEVRLIAPFEAPLQLPAGSHGLELRFAALSFSAPEKVRFEYRFDGISPDWKDAGNSRLIRLHLLPSGDYVFRVRAANNDGAWNEAGTSLAFSVLPFFWQTWWFRLGTGVLLVASGGVLAWAWSRQRVARALERERLAHETQVLRDELAHASRVSTMGQLASGLAHELGQPLSAILRNAEAAEMLMDQQPADLEEIRAILGDIRQDDQRATGVIDHMRALLKRQHVERTPMSLDDLLREVVALTRFNLAQAEVQLSMDVPPDLPPVDGDRVQLQQVLLNLFVNGIAAMSQQPPERRRLVVSARNIDPRRVELSVRDFGPGVPTESLARVFEPFYSTKPEGMGMGLAVSKTIIEAHHGKIWAENHPDGGACFAFTLPTREGIR
jgi:signal transduction histidine kinase/ligand-binding sensor domain-containing protein